MKSKHQNRAFGIVGLLIVLVVIAILVFTNWESVKELGDAKVEQVEEGKEQIKHFQDEAERMQKDMQERLDRQLEKTKPE